METRNRNVGPLTAGVILIAFGLLALASQLFRGFDFWGTFWPLILVGIGVVFYASMFASGRPGGAFAIPATILTGLGLLFLFQTITGYWESWAYGWTIILMLVGIGIYLSGWWSGRERQREAGARVFGIGLIMFVVFGAFFEMIFQSSALAQLAFPLALIILGGYLILTRARRFSSKPEKPGEVEEPETVRNKK